MYEVLKNTKICFLIENLRCFLSAFSLFVQAFALREIAIYKDFKAYLLILLVPANLNPSVFYCSKNFLNDK